MYSLSSISVLHVTTSKKFRKLSYYIHLITHANKPISSEINQCIMRCLYRRWLCHFCVAPLPGNLCKKNCSVYIQCKGDIVAVDIKQHKSQF